MVLGVLLAVKRRRLADQVDNIWLQRSRNRREGDIVFGVVLGMMEEVVEQVEDV